MPNTPNYALPYPGLSDTADVPRDMQALATKLDGLALMPPVVSSLPGSPVNGQEIYFQDANMSTNGVMWHLRYVSAVADAFKWEFVGGAALWSVNNVADATTATLVVTANCPSITMPLAGNYHVDWGASMRNSVASQWVQAALMKNGAQSGVACVYPNSSGTPLGVSLNVAAYWMFANMAAGDVLAMGINHSGGTGAVSQKFLRLAPIRVG